MNRRDIGAKAFAFDKSKIAKLLKSNVSGLARNEFVSAVASLCKISNVDPSHNVKFEKTKNSKPSHAVMLPLDWISEESLKGLKHSGQRTCVETKR